MYTGFLPASGLLQHLQAPPNSADVRVETGVREGDSVSTFYDPMISKLVVWAPDRQMALKKLEDCLAAYQVHCNGCQLRATATKSNSQTASQPASQTDRQTDR
jgi:acetyl/propionyl-CoA carboxylase alpha subunit